MFVIVVLLLHWTTGVLTQGVFDPSTFTQAACFGNNQWTQWFDSGNPSPTVGEFEVTNHIQQLFSSFMCAAPIAIEARTVNDISPTQTGDIFRLNVRDGFLCLNQQVNGFKQKLCTDYKVRYCCPPGTVGPIITTFPTPIDGRTCGRRPITLSTQRIVGGVEAVRNSWPWIVSLRTNGHFCGGTLIDAQHVVTAAHCITDVNPGSLNVIAGLHEQSNINTGRTQIRSVSRIFMHEQYNSRTEANDIAILRLSQPVTFNNYVSPICLPGPDPQESQPVTTIGWGTIYQDGPSSNVLREVTVQVANAEASAAYRDFNVQRQIGAGVPYVGGKDSCQGDSGGPLMYNSNGVWYLSGVVSFGNDCALRNNPGIYTRTSAYLNWINNKINAP